MASRIIVAHGDREHQADVPSDGTVEIDGDAATVVREPDGHLTVTPRGDGPATRLWSVRDGDAAWVFVDGCVYVLERRVPGWSAGGARRHDQLSAPMPASVRQVLVTAGAAVRKGDVLILLEAMKMELPIRAAADGVVRTVRCAAGDLVQPGVPLLEMEDA